MTSRKILCTGWVLFAVLTVFGFARSLFISLDIDESYMVALSWRLASGDSLFVDLWEPHQLSAWLSAIFLKLWYLITGSVDYSVIFLRFAGILIHIALGVVLYRQLKKELAESVCMLILFLHLNYLPKWVQSMEFELMHYWFMLGMFLFLNQYFTDGKRKLLLAAGGGLCLVGSMTVYPTMIILYPFCVIGVYVLAETADIWNENNAILDEYLEEGDQLLYVGAETLIYVRAGITAATPSTISTPVFGNYFLNYYEENPDRIPNVIVVDKTFETTAVYNAITSYNTPVYEWIAENYADAEVIETDYMIIYRADS